MSTIPSNAALADPSIRTTARTAAAAKQTTLNYDNFLRLLLAQMKNQNPTDPMKSTEYMGQLATFSQVEQSVNMNSKLDSLLAASTMSQAGSLVGRTITSQDGTITGRINAVEVTQDGLLTHLNTGEDVPYGPGVTIA